MSQNVEGTSSNVPPTGGLRFSFNANISRRDLAETYLKPFETAVLPVEKGGGGAQAVMCSYSAVNGTPSCANPYFMQTLMRETWGCQDCYVESDCTAVSKLVGGHHYAPDQGAAARLAVEAGLDIVCDGNNITGRLLTFESLWGRELKRRDHVKAECDLKTLLKSQWLINLKVRHREWVEA